MVKCKISSDKWAWRITKDRCSQMPVNSGLNHMSILVLRSYPEVFFKRKSAVGYVLR